MNRVFTILATLSLVILMGAGSLYAQSRYLRVNVPFDFVLADQTFPAGDYTLVRVLDHNNRLYRIQGRKTDQWAFIYANLVVHTGRNETRAVFRLEGHQYRLAEFSFQGTKESLVPISTGQTVAGLHPSDQ